MCAAALALLPARHGTTNPLTKAGDYLFLKKERRVFDVSRPPLIGKGELSTLECNHSGPPFSGSRKLPGIFSPSCLSVPVCSGDVG
jgi:predicted nucleic acid binding AN1-type Zn finger protein